MKKLLLMLAVVLSAVVSYADVVNYDTAIASDSQKQLVSKAIEVSKIFGPEYPVENATLVQISGPYKKMHKFQGRPDLDGYVGKEYYDVVFYNPSLKFDGVYLSKVSIWSDGEPKTVSFGGYIAGLSFVGSTVEQVRENGFEYRPETGYLFTPKPIPAPLPAWE